MREAFVDFIKRELEPKTVLIACGLPASYKTETTEVIAEIKGYKILRSDLIRLEVLKNEDIFDEKVASSMKKRMLVYDEMFRMAGRGCHIDNLKDRVIPACHLYIGDVKKRCLILPLKGSGFHIGKPTPLPVPDNQYCRDPLWKSALCFLNGLP